MERIITILNNAEKPLSKYKIAKRLSKMEGRIKGMVSVSTVTTYLNQMESPKLYEITNSDDNRCKVLYSFSPIKDNTKKTTPLSNKLININDNKLDYYKHIETAFAYIQNKLSDSSLSSSKRNKIEASWELILRGLGYSFNDEEMEEDEIMSRLINLNDSDDEMENYDDEIDELDEDDLEDLEDYDDEIDELNEDDLEDLEDYDEEGD